MHCHTLDILTYSWRVHGTFNTSQKSICNFFSFSLWKIFQFLPFLPFSFNSCLFSLSLCWEYLDFQPISKTQKFRAPNKKYQITFVFQNADCCGVFWKVLIKNSTWTALLCWSLAEKPKMKNENKIEYL